jgi:predicted PurR-regulated permease PerM
MTPQSGPVQRIALDRLSLAALRFLIIGVAGYGVLLVWSRLQFILLPFFVAVLLTALLAPVATVLHRRIRLPRVAAAILTVVLLLALILGMLAFVAPDIASQAEDIAGQVERGITQIPAALSDLGLKDADIQKYSRDISTKLQDSIGQIGGVLGSGVVTAAAGVANAAAGVVLAVMLVIYLLIDGLGFWRGFLRFAPADRRTAWHEGGLRAWGAVSSYVRSQVIVAAIDGIGVAIGLTIIGVPLAVPLGILTFILAFIPFVGAIVAGGAAVLVALSTNGVDGAIGAIVVVLVVQQVESNVLQPILIGRSVSLHPITVLLGVGAGTALIGLTGAFLAAPVIASVSAAAGWLDGDEDLDGPDPDALVPADGRPTPDPDAGGGSDAERGSDAGGGSRSEGVSGSEGGSPGTGAGDRPDPAT